MMQPNRLKQYVDKAYKELKEYGTTRGICTNCLNANDHNAKLCSKCGQELK